MNKELWAEAQGEIARLSNLLVHAEAEISRLRANREQRRYEIARDVMAAMISGRLDHSPTILAPMAVEHADTLLEALEESSDAER